MTGIDLLMAARTFGIWLAEKRLQAGISQEELANRTSFSKSYISTLEGDKPNSSTGRPMKPTVERVDSIARALGAPISEARLAAGYAPKEAEPFANQIDDEEFTALYHKFRALPDAETKTEIKALLKMVDRELDARLKTKKK